jgi:two-component system, LytTR family, response regulator
VPDEPRGPAPLRVLIVDDERLARLRLEDLLRREPGVEIVGTAHNGARAVEAIRELHPDLVFLDVQMPVMTGLDVVREVGLDAMPLTIFVTAFDQYALQAFDVAAVDYLVKPFADERFEQAFQRARRQLTLEGIERQRGQLLAALNSLGDPAAPAGEAMDAPDGETAGAPRPSGGYLERIAVETKGKIRAVPVGEIDYIVASGSYAELYVGDRRYIIRERMQVLEERLDPAQFMRVHRSVIVRLSLVELLHRSQGGDYQVQLRGGVRLPVSRGRHPALERWLGVGG